LIVRGGRETNNYYACYFGSENGFMIANSNEFWRQKTLNVEHKISSNDLKILGGTLIPFIDVSKISDVSGNISIAPSWK
jgi:hypothetical protein